MTHHWAGRFGAIVLLAFALTGCGDNITHVTGKVSYLSVPVTGGSIKLVFEGREPFVGAISPNGTYAVQVQGAKGIAKVGIETESARGVSEIQDANPLTGLSPDVKAKMEEATSRLAVATPVYMKIPSKFADPAQSGLTVELKSRHVTKNFDLGVE